MNRSYGITCGAIPELVPEGFVERDGILCGQYKIEGSGSGTLILLQPLFQSVAPKCPKLRGTRGDLGPMVTNEKEVEPSCSPSKSPTGMTFQRKTSPRISGGARADMFSNEFRARLSWMTSPRSFSIYFSKASMELTLISGPIPDGPTYVRYRETYRNALTHTEDDA